MIVLQMASTIAMHLLSQLDARHGHHPVQGLQQGVTDDDHDEADMRFLLYFSASEFTSPNDVNLCNTFRPGYALCQCWNSGEWKHTIKTFSSLALRYFTLMIMNSSCCRRDTVHFVGKTKLKIAFICHPIQSIQSDLSKLNCVLQHLSSPRSPGHLSIQEEQE